MEELLCVMCGNPGYACIDPFIADVYNEDEETILCDYCYGERCDEI